MHKLLWITGYTVSAVLGMVLVGGIGILRSVALTMAPAPAALAAAVVPEPAPIYDASKPTVAVVLGNTRTEVTDFLVPYAMFAESGAYNVYAVAESRTVRTLAGGVDVVPQRSFAELAALLPQGPDIIIVPAMTKPGSPENGPVLAWLRQHGQGQTLVFSWCVGAEVLAASGLIDGKTVTTHWDDIDRLERAYPAVTWQRGERYIDTGTLVTTGGITAGVDATLHVLTRRNGQAIADTVARAMHYPASPFIANPHMEQYTANLADTSVWLHAAFDWPRRQMGVWLYDGVGEIDLAAVVDVYQASMTNVTATVAAVPAVVSQHGLQVVPRWQADTVPVMDRVLVPGGNGAQHAAERVPAGLSGTEGQIMILQNDQAPTYAFLLALHDLAAAHDVPAAAVAAKRLEVRSPLHLVGPSWPWKVLRIPVLAAIGGGMTFWSLAWLSRRAVGAMRRSRRWSSTQAVPPRIERA